MNNLTTAWSSHIHICAGVCAVVFEARLSILEIHEWKKPVDLCTDGNYPRQALSLLNNGGILYGVFNTG